MNTEVATAVTPTLPTGFRPERKIASPEWTPIATTMDAETSSKVAEEKIAAVTTAALSEKLAEDFVYSDDVAKILSRAIRTGKNVILWGPPGHAKSAMVVAALDALDLRQHAFVLDFGEGMDEPTLWGGLDFQKLHDEHVLDFQPERSFLNSPVVVFEELFDAPPQVLCALKNTLTSKCLSKSSEQFPMRTKVIIVCTNKAPEDIAALGDSAKALIERFPLQLKVEWPDYSAKSYANMFEKLGFTDKGFNFAFAEIIASAGNQKVPISPRTAMHAYQVVRDSAAERGVSVPDSEALSYLRYVPGLEEIGVKKAQELAELMEKQKVEQMLQAATDQLEAIAEEFDLISDPAELLQRLALLSQYEEELAQLKPKRGMTSQYDKTMSDISSLSDRLSDKMVRLAGRSLKKG
jgi:hypothetical protein